MSTEPQSLSNNINALGELVERYGYAHVAKNLAEIVLFWDGPDGAEGDLWRKLLTKMNEHLERPEVKEFFTAAIRAGAADSAKEMKERRV